MERMDGNAGTRSVPPGASPAFDPMGALDDSLPRPLEGVVSSQPYPWNLEKFYQDAESGPWNHLGIGGVPPARHEDHRGHGRTSMVTFSCPWQDYRSAHAPQSECGTIPHGNLPSDSGYSSQHPRPAVDTASICTGGLPRDQDVQSVTSHVGRMNVFGTESISQDAMRAIYWKGNAASSATQLICKHCNKTVKTRSELKKHEQRHVKPFECPERDCPRRQHGKPQGFSTPNDLLRHKRTVHHDRSASGDYYRCNLDQCQNKNKLWPRADNFRSHLRRIHGKSYMAEDSLSAFIDRQSAEDDLDGMGEMESFPVAEDAADEGIDISPVWPTMDMDAPQNKIVTEDEDDVSSQDDQETADLDLELPKVQFRASVPGLQGGAHFSIPQASQRALDELINPSLPSVRSEPASESRNMQGVTTSTSQGSRDSEQDATNLFLQEESMSLDSREDSSPPQSHGQVILGQKMVQVDANRAMNQSQSATSSTYSPIKNTSRVGTGDDSSADTAGPDMGNGGASTTEHAKSIGDVSKSDEEGSEDEESQEQPEEPCAASSHTSGSELGEEQIVELLQRLPQEMLAKCLKKAALAKKTPLVGVHSNNTGEGGKNASAGPKQRHECPDTQCRRAFFRKCELKKHMKRHAKPYGCTFPPCTKRFGSKSDWKRHENSQHFQLEIWECDEKKVDSAKEACKKICYRRETFKHHLQKDHRIEDAAKLEEKQEKCRVGRRCDAKFWCGFCERSIEVTHSRLDAWTERFNHIDDHFSGRNNVPKKEISEWKTDADLPDVDLSRPLPPELSLSSQSSQSDALGGSPCSSHGEALKLSSSVGQCKRRRPKTDGPAQSRASKRQRSELGAAVQQAV